MNPTISYRSNIFHFVFVLIMMSLTSCFENPEKARLNSEIISISDNQITINTEISSDGGSTIFQKGLAVGSSPGPTVLGGSVDGGGSGSYSSIIQAQSNQTFYIRAYAINGAGISYGNELKFSAIDITFSDPISPVTGPSAFFRMRANSNEAITSKGICWGTSPDPTVDGNKIESGPGEGIYETTITGLSPGTTYYARPFATNSNAVFYGAGVSFQTLNIPALTTKEIRNANTFVPTSGGTIVSEGGFSETGICYSTHPMPTVDDTKTADYLNYLNNSFESNIAGVQPSTTYYVRAYATNVMGIGYGNEIEFTTPAAALTDQDGYHYASVTIGTQVWTTENLRTTKFANGDPIPLVNDEATWRALTTGACSYPEYGSAYEYPYGKMYNWFAVTDARNVCPTGWHYPSDGEWQTLIQFLGGVDVAGDKLKEIGNTHWTNPNPGATNSSGFTGLPAGSKAGSFGSHGLGDSGIFWSTSELNSTEANSYFLWAYSSGVLTYTYLKQYGFSVRCVKD